MDLAPVRILSLAQLTNGQDWRITLAHDREEHVLFWLTRGQGLLMLDGRRRGLTVNNFISVPPKSLFSFDPGRNALGMVALIPPGTSVVLPQEPLHLRLRDTDAIAELAGTFDLANREANAGRALAQDALDAHIALLSVWLRRQMASDEHLPPKENAAARLSARFCRMVSECYFLPQVMADYAQALDVTPTHLTRACKAASGRTAADLLSERILHAARTTLEETQVPAQDIARHLGFGSAAYFTRFMPAQTGMTPTQLRAAKRDGPNAS